MDNDPHLWVFFDGACPFCVGWVKWLADRDGRDALRFAPLQGHWARQVLAEHGLAAEALESLVVWDGVRLLTGAMAVRRVAATLPGIWRLAGRMFGLLPASWQEGLYRFVAARRYRWFGRYPACWVPEPAARRKFLDTDSTPAKAGIHANPPDDPASAHPRQGHL